MGKIFTFVLLGLFLFSFASAQSTYQVDVENNYTIVCYNDGYCSAAAYCNINIEDPTGTVIISDVNMTNNGATHNYTFTPTELGLYTVSGYCVDGSAYAPIDGEDANFLVTYNGTSPTSTSGIIVLTFLAISFLFILLGYIFEDKYWILRMFFNFGAVGMGILSVNSAKLIANQSSSLGKMGNVGLTLVIVVMSIFFLYIFVNAFKEIIKVFKEKGDLRWSYD